MVAIPVHEVILVTTKFLAKFSYNSVDIFLSEVCIPKVNHLPKT